jgi:hypothetical protein
MPLESGGLINCRAVPDSAIISNSRSMGGYVEDRIPIELVRHEDGETVVDAPKMRSIRKAMDAPPPEPEEDVILPSPDLIHENWTGERKHAPARVRWRPCRGLGEP